MIVIIVYHEFHKLSSDCIKNISDLQFVNKSNKSKKTDTHREGKRIRFELII